MFKRLVALVADPVLVFGAAPVHADEGDDEIRWRTSAVYTTAGFDDQAEADEIRWRSSAKYTAASFEELAQANVIRWRRSARYPAATSAGLQTDPIRGVFRLDAQYWKCIEAPTIPKCTHISTLTFWHSVDLGYRRHAFHGHSAITKGGVPWGAWTGKNQRVVCAAGGSGVLCGPWMRVPSPKNRWSVVRYYQAFRLMHGDWFRSQASACFDDWCGVGFNRSVLIYCVARQKQCYFDV